jgi:hypothetical protein
VAAALNHGYDSMGKWTPPHGHYCWIVDEPYRAQLHFRYENDEVTVHTYIASTSHFGFMERFTGREIAEVTRAALMERSWSVVQWLILEYLVERRKLIRETDPLLTLIVSNTDILGYPREAPPVHQMFHYPPRTLDDGDSYGAIYWETVRGYRCHIGFHKDKDKEAVYLLIWQRVGTREGKWEVHLNTDAAVGMAHGILTEGNMGTLKVLVIDHLWMDLNIEPPDEFKQALESIP